MFSFLRAFPRATAPVLAALALLLSSTGGSVLASNTGVAPVLVPYTINVLAGNSQSSISGYSGEGVLATNATLSGPNALAVDSVGNVYIADQSNALLREVNAQTGIIKTIAGQAPTKCTGTVCTTINSGCADGVPALGSQVGSRMQGLVVDGFGNVYFSDYNLQGVWVIYHGGAQVASFITLVDSTGVATAGGVKPGYVYHIAGIATPKAGGGCTATAGLVDQVLATQASFHNPLQMGIDAAGNLYVQDTANDVVRVINTQSTTQKFFGTSVQPGFMAAVILCSAKLTNPCPATAAPFGGPANQALYSSALQGLTADQYGNVYQLDGKGTPAVNFAGVAYAGGSALAHLINIESGLTATPGDWYQVINNISSANGASDPVTGKPLQALFANNANNIVLRPNSIVVDPIGNLYMMDYHWISVYRVDVNNGMATRINGYSGTAAGTATAPTYCSGTSGPQTYDAYGDGCGIALAKFNSAGTGYVTFDGAGNLYISDTGNNIVRKVSVGTRFPATATGAAVTQTLQLHFDGTNLPAATNPFKIASASADFTINGTPTCSNYTLGLDASTECYVNVTFSPTAPGARAATLQATTANGSVYPFPLSGFANGAQIAIDGGTPTPLPATGLGSAAGVAIDALGNTYIADAANNQIVMLPAGGGPQTTVPATGLKNPQGVAVDPQGNVYISDGGNSRVLEISATTGAQTVLTTNVTAPGALALDPAGNLYVADPGASRIVEISPYGDLAPSPVSTGSLALGSPVGIAIDKLGNLYVADSTNSKGLIKITAGGGDFQPNGTALPPPATLVSFGAASISAPGGVAIDGAGNLYVSDFASNTVTEIPSGTGPGSEPFQLNFPGLKSPTGLALDSAANLYVVDAGNKQVLEDNRSSLALNFGTVYAYQTPGTVPLTVTNVGTTPYVPTAPFATVSGGNSAAFTETDTCTASNFPQGTLTSGLHCSLKPTFTPTTAGTSSATMSVQGGIATISLTGVGLLPQALLTLSAAAPGGLTANHTATITVTVTQPTSKAVIPSGGQLTFSYTVNGVLTTLPAVTLPPSGIASFNLPTLLLGRKYVVNASYSGDAGNSAANASPLTFFVPGNPITVTANSLTYVYGSTVPQPTGTVTGILPADQATVKYTFSTTATPSSPVGTYPIVVTFSGGNYQDYGFPTVYNANGTTPATVTETQAPLTVTVANATNPYGALSVTYTLTSTGLVNGDTLSALSYTPPYSQPLNVGTYAIVPTLSAGVVSGYDKINNYKVTVNNGTLTVTQASSAVSPPPAAFSAILPTAVPGAGVKFSVGPAGYPYGTPTGTLTVQDVFTPLTSTGTLPPVTKPPVTLTLAGGAATYTLTDPTLGTHVYTASYSGDANFAPSSSPYPVSLLVDVADFTVVSTTSPVQVAPGITPGGGTTNGQQAATPETAVVVIAPVLGYNQTVNLTCTSPVSYLTCTIAPASVTLSGTASQTAIISLSTPATLPLGTPTGALRQPSRDFEVAFIPLALLTMLPLCSEKRRRLRATRLLALLAGVAILAGLSGCGGGNSVAFFTPVPAGQQQVTVTGTSGGVSRSFVVPVAIQ